MGWRLQGRLTALRNLETSLPRGQAEKGTGTPRLKGGPWGGGLYGPWRRPRSPISLLDSKPGLCGGDRRPARGRQALAAACSRPRPAVWARSVTRKRSGSGSGVSAGRMAADTQVRRAAAGPTRPADGCGRRPRGRTACVASLGVWGAAAAESAAPGPSRAGSSRLRLRDRPGPPAPRPEAAAPASASAAGAGQAPSRPLTEVHLSETLPYFSEALPQGANANSFLNLAFSECFWNTYYVQELTT